MSVKIERLNDQFQKEISMILQTEIKDQDIHFVTITDCDITNDRGELSRRIQVRHTPELRFIYDESIEYGNKIEKIIEKINEEE